MRETCVIASRGIALVSLRVVKDHEAIFSR